MFWTKKSNSPSPEKLPSPKGIAEPVGRHLIVAMQQDPDWVWGLHSALRPHPEDGNLFDFRVFDGKTAASRNIRVKDFNFLDAYADLILFEGVFNKKTFQVSIAGKEKKEG
jgi:hypothetical protein